MLFAVIIASMLSLAATCLSKMGTEEYAVASSDCWRDYGAVTVECVGTDGVCILYGGNMDKVCPGRAYATEISSPVE